MAATVSVPSSMSATTTAAPSRRTARRRPDRVRGRPGDQGPLAGQSSGRSIVTAGTVRPPADWSAVRCCLATARSRPHGHPRTADRARRHRPRGAVRSAHRRRRAQRRRQVDAAAGPRRPGRARPRARRADAADGDGRLPAAGTVARSDETVTDFLARRTGVAAATPSSTRRRRRSPPASRAPTTATPPRSTAGWRSAAPTSRRASARCGPSSARPPGCSTSRRRRCRAVRRHASDSPRCCSPASTCSCSTSRRTTSTSTGSTLERWIADLPAGVVLVSHDRTFLARTVTDVLELDEFTHRATLFAGGWQAYLDEREVARRARVGALRGVRRQAQRPRRAGPARAGVGDAGPVEGQEGPTSRTRTSAPSRSTRPSSSPARRRGPRRRSSGSRPSTSRGSAWQLRLTFGSAGSQRRRRRPPRRRRGRARRRSRSGRSTW